MHRLELSSQGYGSVMSDYLHDTQVSDDTSFATYFKNRFGFEFRNDSDWGFSPMVIFQTAEEAVLFKLTHLELFGG